MPNAVSGRVVKMRMATLGSPDHRQVELGALALADPVALHGEHALRPAREPVAPVEQLLRVLGDLEEPALDLLGRDLGVAAPAPPRLHLLVGEDGLTRGAPVHGRALLVGEPALEHADEDELLPPIVRGIAGGELAVPVVGDAHAAELAAHVLDVLVGPHRGVHAVVDGGVLGGQPEGVPAHRVEHVEAPHPLVTGEEIADGVDADVAHVDAAGRIREHLEAVVLGSRGILASRGTARDSSHAACHFPSISANGIPLGTIVGGHIRAEFTPTSRGEARNGSPGTDERVRSPGDEPGCRLLLLQGEVDGLGGFFRLRHGLGVLAGVVELLGLGGELVRLGRAGVGLAGGGVLDLLDQEWALKRQGRAGRDRRRRPSRSGASSACVSPPLSTAFASS